MALPVAQIAPAVATPVGDRGGKGRGNAEAFQKALQDQRAGKDGKGGKGGDARPGPDGKPAPVAPLPSALQRRAAAGRQENSASGYHVDVIA